jgi:hypothetical protein
MKTLTLIALFFCITGNLFAAETIALNDKLSIYGDSMEGGNGRYTLSGNVHINHLLFFNRDVVVETHPDQNSKIITDAKLYVQYNDDSIHYLKNYVKTKTFKAIGNRLVIENSRFTLNEQVGGFDVLCETFVFDEEGEYLDAGYIPKFPGIIKDILSYALSGANGAAGDVDLGIQYFKDGTTHVRCNVEDLVYVSPVVFIYDFNLNLDSGENVFGGGFTLQIPAPFSSKKSKKENTTQLFNTLFGDSYAFSSAQDQHNFSELAARGSAGKFLNGIIVDMRFVEGAIESFTLGLLTSIPIGPTGVLLTRIKGSASGLKSDRLALSATVNLGTVLDPLITLEDLGVKIKTGYISGGGKIKIFKKKISSGKIYYSKKKKALKVSGRLNLGGVLKGKVKAGIRKSKFSGSSKLSVKTPEIDFWSFKWLGEKKLGYAHASIHKNTRFRAKMKYKDVKFAIQAKYKSSYPYFKFYVGSNYKNLRRVTSSLKKGAGYTSRFNVDENVRDLILVAGNDTELFDFTATDPTGAIYNKLNTQYEPKETAKQTLMKITNPKQGEWTFNTEYSGEVTFNALQINQPPSFMFHLPIDTANALPRLSCSFSDYQDTVNVEFYYDTDNKDYDGTLIDAFEFTNNATIDFSWDNFDIDNGKYYIYAVVDDGKNAPLMQYAPAPIWVNNSTIPAPENLSISQTADSALVTWTLNDNPDIIYTQVYARHSSTGEMTEYTSVTDSVYLTNLVDGQLYEVWATYQNKDFLNSFASEVAVYTHLNPSGGNNKPYFTLPPEKIFTFQSGEPGQYALSAKDEDGDPLNYNIIDMPTGMNLTGDHFSWRPTEEDQGVYNLKFTVSDGKSIDSVYHEIIVYNAEQAQISIQYSSLNLYKGDNLYLIVNHLHNSLPTINCSWKNPFTNEDINVELRKIDEFTYIGKMDIPDFPTSIMGAPVNFEDYPIVATYTPSQGSFPSQEGSANLSPTETYTTSGIYNPTPQGTDETPPAPIDDLKITKLSGNQLLLTWTAPGDDANTGKAYSYDLRYHYTSILSEDDFNNSFQFESEPYPQTAGSIDTLIVELGALKDIRDHDQIYFTLKAIDESNNKSELGNNDSIHYLFEASNVQYTIDDQYTVTLNWAEPSELQNPTFGISGTEDEVTFLGYNIYRKVDNQAFTLLQNNYAKNTYSDTLKDKGDGNYLWAVESAYNTGNGEKEYSDTLKMERFNDISIVCRLEGASKFEDIQVRIEGLDAVYHQVFSTDSDSSGLTKFLDVFNSQYKITAHKPDYKPIADTIVVNKSLTEFSYLLPRLTGIAPQIPVPKTTRVYQNYPNPFNASTSIRYELVKQEKVRLDMYNINGQLVKSIMNQMKNAGVHYVNFDANDLSSGLYFLHFKTGSYHYTLKLMLLK